MKTILAIAAIAFVCAGCGSQGTLYRGAPPAGLTHKQYAAQLTGQSTMQRTVDRSPPIGSRDAMTGAPTVD